MTRVYIFTCNFSQCFLCFKLFCRLCQGRQFFLLLIYLGDAIRPGLSAISSNRGNKSPATIGRMPLQSLSHSAYAPYFFCRKSSPVHFFLWPYHPAPVVFHLFLTAKIVTPQSKKSRSCASRFRKNLHPSGSIFSAKTLFFLRLLSLSSTKRRNDGSRE